MSDCTPNTTVRLFFLLSLGAIPFASASAANVVVQLNDGRTVSGEIDSHTNDQRLWLHAAEPSIVLRSSFAWSDIISAQFEGQSLTSAELRPLAIKVRTAIDHNQVNQRRLEIPIGPGEGQHSRRLAPRPLRAADVRVASLHLYATVASWDDDPEDDGLLVYIYPLTTDGIMRPVDGQLNLKLFGRITRPSLNRQHFPELTRNSVRVRATDFGPDGAVYKFPFRNFHPEKHLDIDVFGLLTGRLVVAGQGAFDASDANVRLRRLSRFRDRLQFQTGERYLPAENRRINP